MFAVIKTGGKQYKVAEGDEIIIEKLNSESGAQVTFENVLMLGDGKSVQVGAPNVEGASVVGTISSQRKGAKVIIMKKRQRNTYRRKKGHRQLETVVTIESILSAGKKAPAKTAATTSKAAKPQPAKKPTKAQASPPKPEKSAPEAKAPAAKKAPAAASDDLTKMKGLGKVFAEKLAAAGVTSFAQIAAFTAEDISALEDQINAAGKFEKNDWVAQAKAFAKDT